MKRIEIYHVLIFIMLTCPASGQNLFEQVYPANEFSPVSAAVIWNRDTVIMAGNAGLIMRSTNAGLTWVDLRPDRYKWNFYDAVSTSSGIYFLAAPTVWNDVTLPEGHSSVLLRYRPRSNTIENIRFPPLPATDSSFLTSVWTYEIAAGNDAVFLLQSGVRSGSTLHRTVDGGLSWTSIPFPDSIRSSTSIFLACHDSLSIAIRHLSSIGGILRHRLFTTTNGGKIWHVAVDFGVAGDTYIRDIHERPAFDWVDDTTIVTFANDGTMRKSTNAGSEWESLGYPPFQSLVKMKVYPDGSGFVLADGHLYHTGDMFATYTLLLENVWLKYFVVTEGGTIIATDDNDDIYRSVDGGTSWDEIRSNTKEWHTIRMGSDLSGVALLRNLSNGTFEYYKTTDGWRTMHFLSEESTLVGDPCRIFPASDGLWYRIEGIVPVSGSIVSRSMDGGSSWTAVLSRADMPVLSDGDAIREIDIRDDHYVGFISKQRLIYSSDRGEKWSSVQLPLHSGIFQLQLFPGKSSWMLVSAEREPRMDTVFHSAGDWTNWTPVLIQPDTNTGKYNFDFLEIHATQDGRCVVLCRYAEKGLKQHNDIYLTSNEGLNWEIYPQSVLATGAVYREDGSAITTGNAPSIPNARLSGVHVFRSYDLWKSSSVEDTRYTTHERLISAGEKSLYLYGYDHIARNATGGINSTERASEGLDRLKIGTPFPHPAYSGGMIRVPVIASNVPSTEMMVTLFDVLGRKVGLPVFAQSVGTETDIVFRIPAVIPGLYFLRCQSADAIAVRPILIERN